MYCLVNILQRLIKQNDIMYGGFLGLFSNNDDNFIRWVEKQMYSKKQE